MCGKDFRARHKTVFTSISFQFPKAAQVSIQNSATKGESQVTLQPLSDSSLPDIAPDLHVHTDRATRFEKRNPSNPNAYHKFLQSQGGSRVLQSADELPGMGKIK